MKFYSTSVPEHEEVPLADSGLWEDLVSHWQHRETPVERRGFDGTNSCYVVSLQENPSAGQLDEILGLVAAQGDRIVGREVLRQTEFNSRTLIGKGRSRELAARATEAGADLLVIDRELSPSQMRNLEDLCGMAVSDREAVILNVFMKHAKTQKARIQVELAHLQYLRPRIRGLGLDMDQQAGGVMVGRGPGETASELMARRLDHRLALLQKAFIKICKSAATQRNHRDNCQRISLVGYTNAGKTTLMNRLTGAGLSAKDSPFETLDTTTRCLTRDGYPVLLSDTVGVIRDLPKRLLASFESTLSEIKESDLIILVVDISDPEMDLHLRTSLSLLERLQVTNIPRFIVFNKCDRLSQPVAKSQLLGLCGENDFLVFGADSRVDSLKQLLLTQIRNRLRCSNVFVPYHASKILKQTYANCRILSSEARGLGLSLTIEGLPHVIRQIEKACEEQNHAC